jgi:hypothetical protein
MEPPITVANLHFIGGGKLNISMGTLPRGTSLPPCHCQEQAPAFGSTLMMAMTMALALSCVSLLKLHVLPALPPSTSLLLSLPPAWTALLVRPPLELALLLKQTALPVLLAVM